MAELDFRKPRPDPSPHADWRADRDSIGHHYTAPEVARLIDARCVDGWPLAYTKRGKLLRPGGSLETILQGTSWEASKP